MAEKVESVNILKNIKSISIAIPLLLLSFIFCGWGNVGHRIISGNSVNSYPQSFQQFKFWKDSLANHASDADYRRGADPNEGPKHYIDYEEYNDFVAYGTVIQDYDSAVAKYGLYAINDAGSLPWTIIKYYDSLIIAFKQKDWHRALLLSADLGHYIADANMPLHLTTNYDGQLSGQRGVHSRYESKMLDRFSSSLLIHQNEAPFLTDVQDYIFTMTYKNYKYVDSVLRADSISVAIAKSNSSDLYYTTFWNLTKNYTGMLFSNASEVLASVMYTAWINAGSPQIAPNLVEDIENALQGFSLEQNYPNPFNPETVINWQCAVGSHVTLKVFDVLGNEVATLVNEQKEAGNYKINFNIAQLTNGASSNGGYSSGIYFYQLKVGKSSQTRKMIYLK